MQPRDTPIYILLVEDDPVDVLDITHKFEKLNKSIEIYTANNGLEALNKLNGQKGEIKIPKPHLIILDTKMPKMNGIEFLRKIRISDQFNDIPVFMVTGLYSSQDKIDTRELNVSAHIVKPLAQDDVVHMYMTVLKLPGFSI